MRKYAYLALALLFTALFIVGCGKKDEPFDAEKAWSRLVSEVNFDAELNDASDYAGFVFGDVADGAEIKMMMADGKYEDAVIMIRLADGKDADNAVAAIDEYLGQRKTEAERYEPAEVPKIENAVVRVEGVCVFCVITNDTATVNDILK